MTIKGKPLKIPAIDLVNIFQLANLQIFQPIEDLDLVQDVYNRVYSIMNCFNATTSTVLQDENLTGFTANFYESDTRGSIATVTIETLGKNDEIENWLFITIGKTIDHGENIQNEDDRYELQPLFMLSGTIEDDSTFTPHDCAATVMTADGKGAHMTPNTPNDVYALIRYADSAFRAIMTHDDMNISTFSFYVHPSQIEIAKQEYEDIKNRTAKELSQYIIDCAELNQAPATSSSIMSRPLMLQ